MADDADLAAVNLDQAVATALSRIDRDLPAGVSGECDECGEAMPRLVGGRCGYCRDGRRPPADRYERVETTVLAPVPSRQLPPPAPVPVPRACPAISHNPEEEKTMGKPADAKSVTITAKGAVLDAIQSYVNEHDSSYGAAVVALIERALATGETSPVAATEAPRDLAGFDLNDLLGEIAARFATAGEAVVRAATARAEALEARMAQVRAALGDGEA